MTQHWTSVAGVSTAVVAVLVQVLLFVFSILRKVAWDYGRLALVTDADRYLFHV